jgi:hypothetical protein
LEQLAICNVRRAWAFHLDLREWDKVPDCFHPEARVTVAWYSGPVAGFIERSKALTWRPEEYRKHWLGNMRADVRGTRAVLETDVTILIREFIDHDLYDYTCYARFYDLLEERDRVWRILEWNTIYDRDRLDPVVPESWDESGLFAQAQLQGPESGFAFMKLRSAKRGRTIPDSIVIRDSAGEAKLRRRGADWLAGGSQ